MPTAEEIKATIDSSQATRERIAANMATANESDATLRDRASRAVDRLERTQAGVRSDYHSPRMSRDRERGRTDPLDARRIQAMDREMAELGREVTMLRREANARRVSGGDGAPRRNTFASRFQTPEGQQYVDKFWAWYRRGDTSEASATELMDLRIKAKLTTQSDPDGAFFIPPEVEAGVQRILTVQSAMRNLARVSGIGTNAYVKIVNVGGTASGWVGERDSRTPTNNSQLKRLKTDVHEIYAQPVASQTSLDDMEFDVESWLAEEVSIKFAEDEGDAFLNGDGVAKARGLLTYPLVANPSFDKTAFTSFGYVPTLVASALSDGTNNGADQLISLIYGLRRPYRAGANFLMNEFTLAATRKLKDTTGAYLTLDSIKAGEPDRLLGYPIETDENMPDISAGKTPILFGDFKRTYLILDRVGIRTLRNPFMTHGEVHFYTTKRVGGDVQWFEAMKFLRVSAS